jgi:hypothetical protein
VSDQFDRRLRDALTHRGFLALVVIGLVAGCGQTVEPSAPAVTSTPSSTVLELPEEPPSPAARAPSGPEEIAAAFLERMKDRGVTYRVEGKVAVGPPGGTASDGVSIQSRYDVEATSYAGRVVLRGEALETVSVTNDYNVVAINGTTDVYDGGLNRWTTVDTPPSARPANPFTDLDVADLVLVGETSEGLYEFEVTPWIGGDPIGEWSDLGIAEVGDMAPATVTSHRTRVLVDADGIPQRLTSGWAYTAGPNGTVWNGSITDYYSAMGLYVFMTRPRLPDGAPPGTSHDVIAAAGPNQTAITEPWVDVLPPDGETAELGLTFEYPDEPVMLGIEGVMTFVSARPLDGPIVMDRILEPPDGTVSVPVGEHTVTAYYRACDGSCSLLDPPHSFCDVTADIEAGQRYELVVQILDRFRFVCALEIG